MRKLPVVPFCRGVQLPIFKNRLDIFVNQKHDLRRPALDKGRFAIVTNVERGMRWTLRRRARLFVRTNGADADAKSCGPGLPTLRPSAQA